MKRNIYFHEKKDFSFHENNLEKGSELMNKGS